MSEVYDVASGELENPYIFGDQGRRLPNPNARCLLHPDDDHTNAECPNQRFSLQGGDLIDLYSPMNADRDQHPAILVHDVHPIDFNSPMSIDQALLMHEQHPVKVPSHHHQKAGMTFDFKTMGEKENLSSSEKEVDYEGLAPLKKARLLSPRASGALVLLVPFISSMHSYLFCFVCSKITGIKQAASLRPTRTEILVNLGEK